MDRLHAILSTADAKESGLLLDELDAALVVPDDALPADVVRMNSQVVFLDVDTGVKSAVVLVYPDDVREHGNHVSILAPVGAALIGLREGETIDWPLPNQGRRRLQVISVRAS
jgi:regulator of nucleoside diphosphate kinase